MLHIKKKDHKLKMHLKASFKIMSNNNSNNNSNSSQKINKLIRLVTVILVEFSVVVKMYPKLKNNNLIQINQ